MYDKGEGLAKDDLLVTSDLGTPVAGMALRTAGSEPQNPPGPPAGARAAPASAAMSGVRTSRSVIPSSPSFFSFSEAVDSGV